MLAIFVLLSAFVCLQSRLQANKIVRNQKCLYRNGALSHEDYYIEFSLRAQEREGGIDGKLTNKSNRIPLRKVGEFG